MERRGITISITVGHTFLLLLLLFFLLFVTCYLLLSTSLQFARCELRVASSKGSGESRKEQDTTLTTRSSQVKSNKYQVLSGNSHVASGKYKLQL